MTAILRWFLSSAEFMYYLTIENVSIFFIPCNSEKFCNFVAKIIVPHSTDTTTLRPRHLVTKDKFDNIVTTFQVVVSRSMLYLSR